MIEDLRCDKCDTTSKEVLLDIFSQLKGIGYKNFLII